MQKIDLFYILKSALIPSIRLVLATAWIFGGASLSSAQKPLLQPIDVSREGRDPLLEGEKHFRNLIQLTFGGDNAEAYWSFDSKRLVFQSNYRDWKVACDQIFMFDVLRQGVRPRMVSTGLGRTTCSYFLPGDSTFLYASTHLADDKCPPPPKPREDGKYLWPIDTGYDIFVASDQGKILRRLTHTPGYDAEGTISPDGKKMVFTSIRNGDLDLYVMKLKSGRTRQVTRLPGYDGGAFFSPDSKWLVFRASRPKTEEELKEYRDLLAQGLVAPTQMEIFVCRTNGRKLRQVTRLSKANWAPFFHPSGQKIIFSSNHHSKRGYQFNLFMVDLNGENLEQISFDPTFDAFPMFSPDGKKMVFSSNRFNDGTRATNVFIADWVD
ncbi:MAG: hypothetical protein FJ344_01180 [Sphingomonadales bacterium]|nr:hypothetical protein [Sphingomonadales bacterium]